MLSAGELLCTAKIFLNTSDSFVQNFYSLCYFVFTFQHLTVEYILTDSLNRQKNIMKFKVAISNHFQTFELCF